MVGILFRPVCHWYFVWRGGCKSSFSESRVAKSNGAVGLARGGGPVVGRLRIAALLYRKRSTACLACRSAACSNASKVCVQKALTCRDHRFTCNYVLAFSRRHLQA